MSNVNGAGVLFPGRSEKSGRESVAVAVIVCWDERWLLASTS